jgi:phytoene/squalene synthetase
MPMMHKQRYLTALNLPAHMRPPVCLRYAIWATAASVSDNYSQYEELLYERARKYVDAAEMKVGKQCARFD